MNSCKLWNTLQTCHVQVYIVSLKCSRLPFFKPSPLPLFATSCAIKSASPLLLLLWQAELHYQCTIQFRRGRLHNLWEKRLDCFNLNMFSEFLDLFCFLFSKGVPELLQRWVTLCAPLITSEFRTMMRKKLTNSQLITMSGNVRICLTKFPHRCVT